MPNEEKEGTEAAVGAWLKHAGDQVAENEPIVEISTDKVTLEIPAPASGVLRSEHKAIGETVHPGELLGTIESDLPSSSGNAEPSSAPSFSHCEAATYSSLSATSAARSGDSVQPATAGSFSPVVRRLLTELGLDPASVPKVGRGGRLTPEDIRAHLASAQPETSHSASGVSPGAITGRLVAHTPMRRSIAAHMTRSMQTAPHVTSVFEADLFHVLADRERRKLEDPEHAPSITAYLIRAALAAIAEVPAVNSRWHEAHLEWFDHVHFGVGTALESGGLVVPVIRNANAMDLLALSNALRELTQKARAGKLTHADMEGGTFTLSNHGVGGSLLAAPIILPHGQAAILGTGKLQKRVVVCETGGRELFRVRPMMYVTLTVDHRVLDGQQTNQFLTALVSFLERPAANG